MYPSWLIVEYASTRLMSSCAMAMEAANSAVKAPRVATTPRASGLAWKIPYSRATMNTPAATMVAEWMRAETGVGPSMASGKPHVQGELPALSHGPAEEQEDDEGHLPLRHAAAADEPRHPREIERACQEAEHEDANEKAQVSNTGDDKGLLCRARGFRLLVPEPDQEVRAEADQLPRHVEQDEVVGQHEREHGKGKKREVREEPSRSPGSPLM